MLLKRHKTYFDTNHLRSLTDLSNITPVTQEVRFYKYIYNKYEKIILGTPKELQEIVDYIETHFQGLAINDKKTQVSKNLFSIFNYDKFTRSIPTKKHPERWGAYKLVEDLNVKVCPYCNRQYITVYRSDEGKTRGTLDHFFDKATYPYLAISFFNLIPSCSVCNSSLKGSKKFNYRDNLHPYESGFEDHIKFSIHFMGKRNQQTKVKEYDISDLLNNSNKFRIKLKVNKLSNPDNHFIRKAFNNSSIFKINALYNFHKDIVNELVLKALAYNEESINNLYKEFEGQLFASREDVLRMVIGNYITENELEARVCAKLIKDISEELGLFELIN